MDNESCSRRLADEVEMEKTKKLVTYSKELRKNMTKEERHLWYDFLKTLPITTNRQRVIGPFIVDFYISAVKLVIELDGSQHYEEREQDKDSLRTEYLENLGLKVLRYSNYDVNNNFDAVCQDILNNIKDRFCM